MRIPIAERTDRLTRWFQRQNERPLLGFYLDSQYPLHRFPGSQKHLPHGYVRPEDVVVADYLADCDRLYELYDQAGGDLVWSAAPFWGLPWTEASLGCPVVADHYTGSTRTQPPPGFADNPIVPEFSAENPWVQKMLAFFPALVQHSAGRYPVGVTLMRGISDLLSALYGGEQFILRMYDAPDEVQSVAEGLAEYWIAFGKCLLSHVPLFHGGTGAFFYSVWCPGKTIWTQEDAAALLSPHFYEQFIYPSVCRVADAFDRTVMHLHPSQFIPTDYLVNTNINVIELHMETGGPSAEELHEHHIRVLAHKPLFIWGDMTQTDLDYILSRLPHKGLAINMVADSPQSAHQIWEKFITKYT